MAPPLPTLPAALLPVLLLLAATFAYAGVAAGSNAYQIGRDYNVSHLWEVRERLAALAGFALLAFLPDLLAGRWLLACASLLLGFAGAACLFSLRFDTRLNIRRGLDKYYIGLDPHTAATDKTVRRLGLSGQRWAALKLAGVCACTALLGWLRM